MKEFYFSEEKARKVAQLKAKKNAIFSILVCLSIMVSLWFINGDLEPSWLYFLMIGIFVIAILLGSFHGILQDTEDLCLNRYVIDSEKLIHFSPSGKIIEIELKKIDTLIHKDPYLLVTNSNNKIRIHKQLDQFQELETIIQSMI